ncbi:MAG: thioredoxin-disulfide reductase [Candidatus Moeniiplasma glomeromycotorum]|nr:thioredoxin-disulfide reductase [Candidatus Moeniiplasma glomeromycotorum]MCE8167557.1 thioredoxin-disulfide reductase [Candidatus Moeniiplasma glomeromycotorum]MCE8169091.1 thioredoxin-disulfide reductase [Candidatus Moeniiplasma glomeromycotorum]
MSYDLIIVGAGPAGLTAAIYAKRACLKTLILEKALSGGKLNKTEDVDNYPGFASIKGPELARQMTEHTHYYEIDWQSEEVIKLEKKESEFIIKTNAGKNFASKAVIIAAGAIENKLGIKGEAEFTNRGVSYCAICDGFLFVKKEVMVVGGGYSALETALYMANVASKVYLIHRRENFRAEKEIIEKIKTNPKITLFLNSVLAEIHGQATVEKVIIQKLNTNTNTNTFQELSVQAVFPCIGLTPHSQFTHQLGVCDPQSYIRIKEDCSTTIPGLFAAGDVARSTEKKIKQIVTAVSEGAIAAQSVIEYLNKIK